MTTVTSYLEEDKKNLIAGEEAEEWKRKVELLGLTGQADLVADSKSPIPFKRMTEADVRVMQAFCPDNETVEAYNKEALPLEVLALLALAKHEHYFESIKVHFSKRAPDPFLVGYKNREAYLIAQWGPEKLSWDELAERAKRAWKEDALLKLQKAVEEAQMQMKTLDSLCNEHFRGGWIHLVS